METTEVEFCRTKRGSSCRQGNPPLEPTHICEGVLISQQADVRGRRYFWTLNRTRFDANGKQIQVYVPPSLVPDVEEVDHTGDIPAFLVEIPFDGLCVAYGALNAPHGYAEAQGWVASSADRLARTVLLSWPAAQGGKRFRLKFDAKYVVNAEVE